MCVGRVMFNSGSIICKRRSGISKYIYFLFKIMFIVFLCTNTHLIIYTTYIFILGVKLWRTY